MLRGGPHVRQGGWPLAVAVDQRLQDFLHRVRRVSSPGTTELIFMNTRKIRISPFMMGKKVL
jgi:hypothetical protein